MRLIETEIPDVRIINLERRADQRGYFCQTFNAEAFRELGLDETWRIDAISRSTAAGTIRGLHFQRPPAAQAKIVRVMRGAIMDIALDLRKRSKTYGRHVAVRLSGNEPQEIYVPRGFAHGFCTLEAGTEISYKLSDRYAPDLEGGLNPFDPALMIDWPVDLGHASVSDRDLAFPNFAEIDVDF